MRLYRLTITLLFAMLTIGLSAQINKPRLSPRINTQQQVGMVGVTLDYGQPNMQGREIFGALIPFGKIWRTGANAATTVSFDREVELAGNVVPEGTYGLYTIPEEKEWTIIIHKDSELWGAGGYDEANDLVRFQVPVIPLQDTRETMSIHFENFHMNGGDMVIVWENTKVKFPLFVDSDKVIFEEIDEKIVNASEPAKSRTYFEAAQFYYHKNKDLNKAMEWFDKAIELRPEAYWFVYYKAELAFHMEDYPLAKETAEHCLELAKASPSSDFGFIAKSTILLGMIEEAGGK